MRLADVAIRQANPTDLDEVLDSLYDAATILKTKGIVGQWPDRFPSQPILDAIDRSEIYVVSVAGIPAATMALQWEDELWWGPQRPIAGYVHRLAVRRQFAGQHLGEYLLDWAAQQIRAAGRSRLRLDCTEHNSGLRRYYERLGFVWIRDVEVHGNVGSLYERPCPRTSSSAS
jgi:ribosomal protein S18 acetylase RimI-like enzyme